MNASKKRLIIKKRGEACFFRKLNNKKLETKNIVFFEKNQKMINQRKKEIRKKIKELKLKYSFEEKKQKSIEIWKELEESLTFQNAKIIMFYWSMNDEVHTHDFIEKWTKTKNIILPSVQGDDLILKKYESKSKLCKGDRYGILEPKGREFKELEKIELIIVPGIAFDKNNNRMGRGKAYYDKLLKTLKAYKVGICFDFQYLQQVPTDEHDIKMDKIILA